MPDYPGRLYHRTPGWVKDGSFFHIRIRAAVDQSPPLTGSALAGALLSAARHYHATGRWFCRLILLMPDHLHAVVAFPRGEAMAMTIRDWKRGAARLHGVRWQMNFFDHRLRDAREEAETWDYVRRNPVVKELCATEADWPWVWSGGTGNGVG